MGTNAAETALRFSEGHTHTYEELNAKANQAARQLKLLGLFPEDVICIAGDKIPDSFIYMLACVKVGCAYSFFDPATPTERLRKILSKCEPTLIAGNTKRLQQYRELFSDTGAKTLEFGPKNDLLRDANSPLNLPLTKNLPPNSPAYISFVSGASGSPKGALITHENVLRLVRWSITEFQFTTADRLTNLNPLHDDNSVFDVFSALLCGAAIVPFTNEDLVNPALLIQKIKDEQCTSWFSNPVLLKQLDSLGLLTVDHLSSIKRILFRGAPFPKLLLKPLFDRFMERVAIHSLYGPVECTAIVCKHRISELDFADNVQEPLPAGTLIADFEPIILTEKLQRVPSGEVGSLCFTGPNIGVGYYGDPEITTDHFRTNPTDVTQRIFITGALAYQDPKNNVLHICGRNDLQINHHGHRVEIQDIEQALCQIANIKEAIVFQHQEGDESALVAVVQTKDGEEQMEADMRRLVQAYLPSYMVPKRIFFAEALQRLSGELPDRATIAATFADQFMART